MIRGKRTSVRYRIGDKVKVQVLRVDVTQGNIDFTLAERVKEDDDKSPESGDE